MIISGNEHIDQMIGLLGSGSRFGCSFAYRVQDTPGGIAQALGMAEAFVDGDSVCALLGDNIFFDDLSPTIKDFRSGGHVFIKQVPDPERFGVVEMEGDNVISVEEKPTEPKSNMIQTGCYVYDENCFDIIHNIKPSARGELEITDVSQWYIDQGTLKATILEDEWIDAGTFESLHKAANVVRDRKMKAIENITLPTKKEVTV